MDNARTTSSSYIHDVGFLGFDLSKIACEKCDVLEKTNQLFWAGARFLLNQSRDEVDIPTT